MKDVKHTVKRRCFSLPWWRRRGRDAFRVLVLPRRDVDVGALLVGRRGAVAQVPLHAALPPDFKPATGRGGERGGRGSWPSETQGRCSLDANEAARGVPRLFFPVGAIAWTKNTDDDESADCSARHLCICIGIHLHGEIRHCSTHWDG